MLPREDPTISEQMTANMDVIIKVGSFIWSIYWSYESIKGEVRLTTNYGMVYFCLVCDDSHWSNYLEILFPVCTDSTNVRVWDYVAGFDWNLFSFY